MSSFKEKYNNDEEFRTKHNNYMNTRIECVGCGKVVARKNLSIHKRSAYHNKRCSVLDTLKYRKKIIEARYDKKIDALEAEKEKKLKKINRDIKRMKREERK